MFTEEIINNVEIIVSQIAEPAIWSEQSAEKRDAFVKCAFYDIAVYAHSVNAKLDFAEEICMRAVAEQAIHIAKQIFVEKNGLVITEENINGLGSRRYQLPDPSTIAERSKMYIAKFIEVPPEENTEEDSEEGEDGADSTDKDDTVPPDTEEIVPPPVPPIRLVR